jgi:sugar/nucleoside kinase (ribokinase family)
MSINKRFDLVVVGEINPDLILSSKSLPEFGQIEKYIDDCNLTIGSSSVIFACGAARLGLKVAFIGKVGDDYFGHYIVNAMRNYGMDVSGVVISSKVKTGLSVIINNESDRAILTYLGTISELRFDEINIEIIKSARHLHLGSYFMLDKLRPDIHRLFQIAKEDGLSTSLDTNFDPLQKWGKELNKTLMNTDMFFPNEREVGCIAGVNDLDSAIQELSSEIPYLVVKLGSKGAVATFKGEKVFASALDLKVFDTIGAGDSFDAGFVFGYLQGWNIDKCLRAACICGSLSTLSSGGTNSQATLKELLDHLSI